MNDIVGITLITISTIIIAYVIITVLLQDRRKNHRNHTHCTKCGSSMEHRRFQNRFSEQGTALYDDYMTCLGLVETWFQKVIESDKSWLAMGHDYYKVKKVPEWYTDLHTAYEAESTPTATATESDASGACPTWTTEDTDYDGRIYQ